MNMHIKSMPEPTTEPSQCSSISSVDGRCLQPFISQVVSSLICQVSFHVLFQMAMQTLERSRVNGRTALELVQGQSVCPEG